MVTASSIIERNASEIWFDDVDPIDIEASRFTTLEDTVSRNDASQPKDDLLQKHDPPEDEPAAQETGTARETKAVALDCEMVGVGLEGQTSILARVSIVNAFGDVLYDEYVKPKERIVDYRTHVSGIRPANLEQGLPLEKVQKDVAKILDKKLLIGHALSNDFKVLMLSHPKKMIRDTAKYKPFKKHAKTAFPSLKKLSQLILQKNIQTGEHSSVEDAKTVMQLYRSTKRDWEAAIKNKHRHVANATTGSNPQATMSGKEKHRLYCARRAIRK